jgi:hypothetical protein
MLTSTKLISVLIALLTSFHGLKAQEVFVADEATAGELVGELSRRVAVGSLTGNLIGYMGSVILEEGPRADPLFELLATIAGNHESRDMSLSATIVLAQVEKYGTGNVTARVATVFRTAIRERSPNVESILKGVRIGSTQLKAQALGWIVPLFARGDLTADMEYSLIEVLPALGLRGEQAVRSLASQGRVSTQRGREKLAVVLSMIGGG